MRIHSTIIDDYLSKTTAEELHEHAFSRDYTGVVNPTDGVLYPDISIDIPSHIKTEIKGKLDFVVDSVEPRARIKPNTWFMRLSKEGVDVPHEAHNDVIMGQYTFLLYLNKEHPDSYGTEIVEHINGTKLITTPEELELWKKDCNNRKKWKVVTFCEGKFNRAFFLRSDLLHRAQPIGGFGKDLKSGRLVLTLFCDIV